ALEMGEPVLELLRIDGDVRRGALRSVEDRGHLAGRAELARCALARSRAAFDADLDRFHTTPQMNSELIDASSWVRRMASASSADRGSTVIFSSPRASPPRGMVAVPPSSSTAAAASGETAGPESTACVAHANRVGAPAARTARAA